MINELINQALEQLIAANVMPALSNRKPILQRISQDTPVNSAIAKEVLQKNKGLLYHYLKTNSPEYITNDGLYTYQHSNIELYPCFTYGYDEYPIQNLRFAMEQFNTTKSVVIDDRNALHEIKTILVDTRRETRMSRREFYKENLLTAFGARYTTLNSLSVPGTTAEGYRELLNLLTKSPVILLHSSSDQLNSDLMDVIVELEDASISVNNIDSSSPHSAKYLYYAMRYDNMLETIEDDQTLDYIRSEVLKLTQCRLHNDPYIPSPMPPILVVAESE